MTNPKSQQYTNIIDICNVNTDPSIASLEGELDRLLTKAGEISGEITRLKLVKDILRHTAHFDPQPVGTQGFPVQSHGRDFLQTETDRIGSEPKKDTPTTNTIPNK